jgi:hypothetical protein
VWVLIFMAAAAISPPAPVYPASPTVLVYRTKDYGGRTYPSVTVKSSAGRVRIEAFGATLLYDGKTWHSETEISEEAAAVTAFQVVLRPAENARRDSFDRPVLIPSFPAGKQSARCDYRYDAVGLLAANLVFADGSGFEFRRISASPGSFSPADFEPPQRVEPQRAASRAGAGAGSAAPDYAGVARLTALAISDREQDDFEKRGGVGRHRPKLP